MKKIFAIFVITMLLTACSVHKDHITEPQTDIQEETEAVQGTQLQESTVETVQETQAQESTVEVVQETQVQESIEEAVQETQAQESIEEVTDNLHIYDSGVCGENLTWTLAYDGILTISGSGEQYSYDDCDIDYQPPWKNDDVAVTEVLFDGDIAALGEYAFSWTSLKTFTIPASVSKIHFGALHFIQTLETIYVEDGNPTYFVDDCNVLYERLDDGHFALVVAPSGSLSGSYTVLDNTVIIYDYAFYGCTGLEEIFMPDSVYYLGNGMLCDCNQVTKFRIPRSSTKIYPYTFAGTPNLQEIWIPKNVLDMGFAFHGCGVNTIYYEGTQEQWQILYENAYFWEWQTIDVHLNVPF